MGFTLRDYQQDSVDALMMSISKPDAHPLLALPTGAGKAVIQAGFIKHILSHWPTERFLLIAHVQELLTQNANKIHAMLPGVGVGIFSAGLKRKDIGYQITVAGIQSLYKYAHRMGDITFVIIDEAHLVSKSKDTMYQKFLNELRKFCPNVRVIGMTATPFRLDSGPLCQGTNRIFTEIAHSVSMKWLIEQGHLSPLVSAKTKTHANLGGVRVQGGEFVIGELDAAVNVEELTNRALDEVMQMCADRVSWITFCVTKEHAKNVTEALLARGVSAAYVTDDTLPMERQKILADFKACRIRAIVSVGVLTTGFDAPNVDALICLRPTKSPGLWVQMAGRGTRLHPGKTNCLVLDFTDNTREHGPVDLITIEGDGNPKVSPMMDCEECGELTPKAEAKCIVCGHIRGKPCPKCKTGKIPVFSNECIDCGFIVPVAGVGREIKHKTIVGGGELISGEPQELGEQVISWQPKRHQKDGSPDSVCVHYDTGLITGARREWVCFEHTHNYAGVKAGQWWKKHGGKLPVPATVTEAMERWRELKMPSEIFLRKDGKFWQITRATVDVPQPKIFGTINF